MIVLSLQIQNPRTIWKSAMSDCAELSKHFWKMKRKGIENSLIHWSVIYHAKPYTKGSKRSNLCLTEKYHILTSLVDFINKRSVLISECHHESNFYFVNSKAIPLDT